MPRVGKKNRDAVERAKEKRNNAIEEKFDSALDYLKSLVKPEEAKKSKKSKIVTPSKVKKFKSGY